MDENGGLLDNLAGLGIVGVVIVLAVLFFAFNFFFGDD